MKERNPWQGNISEERKWKTANRKSTFPTAPKSSEFWLRNLVSAAVGKQATFPTSPPLRDYIPSPSSRLSFPFFLFDNAFPSVSIMNIPLYSIASNQL